MKMKLILASTLALFLLASCTEDEHGGNSKLNPDVDVAYISIKVEQQSDTRASGEDDGADESDIKSLYLVTFDKVGNIVGIPGTIDYFTEIITSSTTPEAVKVSAKGTHLLVIANPGSNTGLMGAINALGPQSTFALFNQAISNATMTDLTDVTIPIAKGFAMINSGGEGLGANDVITNPLIDVTSNIKKTEDYANEAQAKAAAEGDRADVSIERLASKLELKVKTSVDTPTNAKFTFKNWTLDAVNSTFYPFAYKTILGSTHNSTLGKYVYDFYTQDPNYTDKAGIRHATVNAQYTPVLVPPYDWMNDGDFTYSIENTMAAAKQIFENATRLVITGTYYPVNTWSGDWFSFAGTDYENLAALQAAYPSDLNLQAACDDMFNKIIAHSNANTLNITAVDFNALTEADLLLLLPNGGEIIKTDNLTPCIRWYQEGLNYYYYIVKHDDALTATMAFAKYGVVRNNWYSLTLAKVNGAGTPWYPDIQNPGPGDPDPIDPIDESTGFLGIEVEVKPWIIWSREIEI